MNEHLNDLWISITTRTTTERGATTTEYALATILIAIVAIVALVAVGGETSDMYTTISDEMVAAGS